MIMGLSLVEIVFALSVMHIVGIIFSLLLILACGYFHLKFGVYQFYNSEDRHRLFAYKIFFFIIIVVLASFVLSFLAIRIAGMDVVKDHFPTKCQLQTNCFRLTNRLATNTNAQGILLYTVNTTNDEVFNYLTKYFEGKGSKLIYFNTNYMHRVIYSTFFGFPDDIYIFLHCNPDHSITLFIQMESRIGIYDFGTNRKRAILLLGYMDLFNPKVKEGKCLSYEKIDSVSFTK